MILAVNTSTIQFGLALMERDGTVVSEYLLKGRPGHFGDFMPAMESLLDLSRVDPGELEALIVATGPGSFTGLRIGLASAKGMAQSLGIPIVGVSGLEALARQVPPTPYPICPILESRKEDLFIALFRWSDHDLVRVREDSCLKLGDIRGYFEEKALVLGNDWKRQAPVLTGRLGAKALPAPAHLWNLRPSSVGSCGLDRYLKGEFDSLRDLVPVYLRPPDIRP